MHLFSARERAGFLKRLRAFSSGNRIGNAFLDPAQHSKSLECCGRGATWFPGSTFQLVGMSRSLPERLGFPKGNQPSKGKPTLGGQARPFGESQIPAQVARLALKMERASALSTLSQRRRRLCAPLERVLRAETDNLNRKGFFSSNDWYNKVNRGQNGRLSKE